MSVLLDMSFENSFNLLASFIVGIGFIIMFSLLYYQYYLFVKIRTSQLNIPFKWYQIFFWKYDVENVETTTKLWDDKYDSIFNTLIKTPIYFLFVDLEFEGEDLKLLNEKRIKVCKLSFLAFVVLMTVGLSLEYIGII